jgi:hypothetical protein
MTTYCEGGQNAVAVPEFRKHAVVQLMHPVFGGHMEE